MNKEKTLVPWFQRGDIGGMTYSITNNIVNYVMKAPGSSGGLSVSATRHFRRLAIMLQ